MLTHQIFVLYPEEARRVAPDVNAGWIQSEVIEADDTAEAIERVTALVMEGPIGTKGRVYTQPHAVRSHAHTEVMAHEWLRTTDGISEVTVNIAWPVISYVSHSIGEPAHPHWRAVGENILAAGKTPEEALKVWTAALNSR